MSEFEHLKKMLVYVYRMYIVVTAKVIATDEGIKFDMITVILENRVEGTINAKTNNSLEEIAKLQPELK